MQIIQQSQLIYMDIGPSISERKQVWVQPDDDRVEYATLNHQHDIVQTENQPVHDSSTVGEPQVKIIINCIDCHDAMCTCFKISSLIWIVFSSNYVLK
jgi:hypothetical protein